MKILKYAEIKPLKEKWHKEQNQICPLFGKKYPSDQMVLDHEHCLSKEKPGDNGKGCCRGVIHKNANVIEGKINNVFKRWGGQKETDLISFLENLLEYYKHNRSCEQIIHPTEAKKLKKTKQKNKKSRVRINRDNK